MSQAGAREQEEIDSALARSLYLQELYSAQEMGPGQRRGVNTDRSRSIPAPRARYDSSGWTFINTGNRSLVIMNNGVIQGSVSRPLTGEEQAAVRRRLAAFEADLDADLRDMERSLQNMFR
jgi:hypothetical protein